MYTSFFGFKENPFTLTPDPKYLFLSRYHKEALDHLLYGINERKGFIASAIWNLPLKAPLFLTHIYQTGNC